VAVGYFDASALVKLVVDEDGSDVAARVWDEVDAVATSRLSEAEVAAALSAATRAGRLSAPAVRRARRDWVEMWSACRVVELAPAVAARAAELSASLVLGGADAVHLASALTLGGADPVMVTWDRRLHAASMAAGLPVVPSAV
jgi:predicted nucleic acid-binding protein